MKSDEMDRSVVNFGRFRSWGASHPGPYRNYNEDRYLNRPDLGLWAVADGAGGHQAGQIASSAVVAALETLPEGLPSGEVLSHVRALLADTHASLLTAASERGEGAVIATTVVVLLARGDHFACLWAGDSRAYLYRDGALAQVTRDHSLVQELVDAGEISEDEAETHPRNNIITRAVGAGPDPVDIDKVTGDLLPGDRFMLCSDGVSKTLGLPHMEEIMGADEDAPAERLVLAALAADTRDNVTAVAIELIA